MSNAQTLTSHDRQVLRAIAVEPCPANFFRREQLKLIPAGLLELSPYAAALGPAAGSRVLRLTEAGKKEIAS